MDYEVVSSFSNNISRRNILRMGLVTLASAMVPAEVSALVKEPIPVRKLSLYNVYTHEKLDMIYWRNGRYLPPALDRINSMFRDSRTGKVKSIDTGLLDLLASVQSKLDTGEYIHIISGYRTPRSNELLRQNKKGAAKNSLHMYGKAVDIRLPGCSLKNLRSTAMSFRQGGVGYYPRSKFVHLDVGQVRYWWG